ncbi:hypothetical protein B4U80_08364 [Leptotrombidium deliense]|uniref:Odorant receptor n=1 Tax=Leptotrombidium deliense TaxID=299467 RepID=A0A443RZ76_9ACAR|nr:hypothetical protein B4U80_08364 [Leptotrombidium deliense]
MTAENFYNSHRLSVQQLGWLEPFQVLLGKKSPHDYGLNPTMTAKFRKRVITKLNTYWLIAAARSVLGSAVFAAVYMNEKEYDENHLKLIWCIVLTIWCHLNSVIIYVTLAFFDCVCYYFRIRYMKVNDDIETVLHNKEKFKQDERIRFMQHILHEHNHLCSKVDEYNLFWSRFISHVFFVFTPVTIYGLYQAIFAQHTWIEIVLLSLVAVEGWSIISLMCFSGAFLNDQAHAPYMQLIRCMFEYYPPDIHLQMRILVQRVSGPAIAFYCSDLFEVAHTSYFAICMALGQNFFLLVDFVQANLAAANMQTNSTTTAVTATEASL